MNSILDKVNKTRLTSPLHLALILSLTLFGCGSDSDTVTGSGYIQLYNASSNAPEIYLTRDKYSDDDYLESVYSPIAFTKTSSRLEVNNDTYDIALSWKENYYSSDDLEIVYENSLLVNQTVFSVVLGHYQISLKYKWSCHSIE